MTSQNDKREFPVVIAENQSLPSANQQNLGMNVVHLPSSSLTIPSGIAASLSAPLHLHPSSLHHPNASISAIRPGTTPIAPAPQNAPLSSASFPIPRDTVMQGNNGSIQMQSFSQAARLRRKDQSSPAVFQNCKLRSGKWIQEEEDYAKVLIELFEKGELTDCENGATLRSYLSLKLHCPPMRISKKFARQGIGKLVFLSKLNVGVSIPSSKLEQNNKRVQEAENKFYQAVFPANGVLTSFDGFLAASTLAAATVPMVPGVVPILPPPIISPPMLPFVPVGGNGNNLFAVPVAPSNQTSETVNPTEPHSSLPIQAVQTGVTCEHTKQLQESYLKALLGHQQPANPTLQAALPITAPVAVQAAGPLAHIPPHVTLNVTQVVSKTQVPAPLTHPSLQLPRVLHAKKEESSTADEQRNKPDAALPDLLADFDMVALRLKQDVTRGAHESIKTEPNVQTAKDPQYSPPFTSRSFDDLHRLLGKDLSPLHDEGDDQKDATDYGKAGPETLVHSSCVAFTAESYALLAQESAMLASQHAAYLPQAVAKLAKERGSSFDFEGTVNIVSSGFHRRPSVESSNRHSLKSKREDRGDASRMNERVGLTPVERLYGSRHMNFISEPSSAAESESHLSSQRGSAEESNGSENASNDESGETSGSSNDSEEYYDSNSDEGPPKKRTKGSYDKDEHLQEDTEGSGVTAWRSMLHHR